MTPRGASTYIDGGKHPMGRRQPQGAGRDVTGGATQRGSTMYDTPQSDTRFRVTEYAPDGGDNTFGVDFVGAVDVFLGRNNAFDVEVYDNATGETLVPGDVALDAHRCPACGDWVVRDLDDDGEVDGRACYTCDADLTWSRFDAVARMRRNLTDNDLDNARIVGEFAEAQGMTFADAIRTVRG